MEEGGPHPERPPPAKDEEGGLICTLNHKRV